MRSVNNLNAVISQFLCRKGLNSSDPNWEIKKSQLGGFGVFAKRLIQKGEIIFLDFPIIQGPRSGLSCPIICANCYTKKDLQFCEQKCGLKLCQKCILNSHHTKECELIKNLHQIESNNEDFSLKITKALCSLRSLLLTPEDKIVIALLKAHPSKALELDFLKESFTFLSSSEESLIKHTSSVLDSNAFELIVGEEDNQSSIKGLYPLGSLANHSCVPNSYHVFNQEKHMVVRASSQIPPGEEIFHSYSRLIWGTPTRRFHLWKTKHFLCKCPRCLDPTEFGSYTSAIRCRRCPGRVVLGDEWKCENCEEEYPRQVVASLMSLLGSVLNSFTHEDFIFMRRFLDGKLRELVVEGHEVVLELKYKIVWILGYEDGYLWEELSEELLELKKKLCEELLKVVEVLKLGQCKMRGLLLYELYCCWKEWTKRGLQNWVEEEVMKENLLEAADIMMYDIGAPVEIKNLLKIK